MTTFKCECGGSFQMGPTRDVKPARCPPCWQRLHAEQRLLLTHFFELWDEYWNTGAFCGPPYSELSNAAEEIRDGLEE